MAGAGFDVAGVLFEEPLVNLGLDVEREPEPGLLVDHGDEPGELGGVLDLGLGFAKDGGDEAGPLAEPEEDVAVVGFEGFAAEVAARIAEELFPALDAPIGRVGALDVPVAYAPVLEKATLPQVDDIVRVLREVCAF